MGNYAKVLKNKEWILKDNNDLETGDIIRYYSPEGKVLVRKYGISELRKISDCYKDDDKNHSNSYNAEIIMLSELLSLKDSKLFIKSLIGKYAASLGRYKFKDVYKSLYDYLREVGINARKRDKPHIDYLTKEELIVCEDFLRYCIAEIDISDVLEKYGLLADESLFQENIEENEERIN